MLCGKKSNPLDLGSGSRVQVLAPLALGSQPNCFPLLSLRRLHEIRMGKRCEEEENQEEAYEKGGVLCL